MSKLSEKKIIELFQSKLGNASFVPEDVESFKIGREQLVVKVDTFVESTDFPPRMKPVSYTHLTLPTICSL